MVVTEKSAAALFALKKTYAFDRQKTFGGSAQKRAGTPKVIFYPQQYSLMKNIHISVTRLLPWD